MDTGIRNRDLCLKSAEVALTDTGRIQAYRSAIRQSIRPGDVVADLGAGIGILSLIAAEAGAAKVYAIEERPEAAQAIADVARANGFANMIEVVCGDAGSIDLGRAVDIVVTGLIGDFGSDKGICGILDSFCARHLKDDGQVIPQGLSNYFVPVAFNNEAVGLWWEDSHGFNLSALSAHLRDRRPRKLRPVHPLAELAGPARLESHRFGPEGCRTTGSLAACFEFDEPVRLEGFVSWFDLHLSHGVYLNSRDGRPGGSWPMLCWPVLPTMEIEPGQVVRTSLVAAAALRDPLNWRLELSVV